MDPVRDSIFISSLRSFCKAIAVVIGIFLAFIPIVIFLMSLSGGAEIESKTTLTILPDANGERQMQPHTSPVILQIKIDGIIGTGTNTSDSIESQLLESRTGLLKNDRVKGILIYLQTPGGTATDSDNIYRMLLDYKERYKVPIFAYADGLCASGGMFISSSADKFYANPSSIIGSIGVVMGPFFNLKETMTKIGVDAVTISEGKNKDMMSPFRTWKPGEDAALKNIGTYYYNRFVDIVTKARPRVNKEKLLNEYGANVFDPVTAEKIGFIDGQNDYFQVMKELLQASNIDPSKPYQVVLLEPKKNFLSSLTMGDSLFSSFFHLFFGKKESKPVIDQFSYLYQPGGSSF